MLKDLLEDRRHPIAHHPRRHGGQREIEREENERAVGEQFARGGADGRFEHMARSRRDARGIAQQDQERQGVKDAGEPGEIESTAPAQPFRIGDVTPETANHHPAINAHLVNADSARTRRAGVKIRDQGQRRRDVKRLADAHQRSRPEQTGVAVHMAGPPRDRRPDEEAGEQIVSFRLNRSAM